MAGSWFQRSSLVLSVVLWAGCCTGNLPPSPPMGGASQGINIHYRGIPPKGSLQQLASTGVKWVRMDFSWDDIEKTKGVYDWKQYDELTAAIKSSGLNAIYILDYSNPLYDQGLSPFTMEGRAAFAAWTVAGMQHFASAGIEILWEMYNEPNGRFWTPIPNVTAYIELALTVGKAVRHSVPQATFIGPATSGIDVPFLTACFKAGLLEYWDAVSVHPYRDTVPESASTDLQELRALIRQHRPAGRPIVSSEWGYSALYHGFSVDRQAKVLPRMWMNNMAEGIVLSIWYDWMNDGRNYTYDEDHFGLVHNEFHSNRIPPYDPKPGFHAAATFHQQLQGKVFAQSVRFSDPDVYGMHFTSPAKSSTLPVVILQTKFSTVSMAANDVLALWCASLSKMPCLVSMAVQDGAAFNVTDYTGYHLPNLPASNGSIAVSLSNAPFYLMPAAALRK